jgi:hypothetical protein
MMKNPRLKLVKEGWQCSGEVGHFGVKVVGLTLAQAYVKYENEMRSLILKEFNELGHTRK